MIINSKTYAHIRGRIRNLTNSRIRQLTSNNRHQMRMLYQMRIIRTSSQRIDKRKRTTLTNDTVRIRHHSIITYRSHDQPFNNKRIRRLTYTLMTTFQRMITMNSRLKVRLSPNTARHNNMTAMTNLDKFYILQTNSSTSTLVSRFSRILNNSRPTNPIISTRTRHILQPFTSKISGSRKGITQAR